jgi:O-antigen/teichoic acid export membrane protein
MREIAKPGTDTAVVFGRAVTATLAVSVAASATALLLGYPLYFGRTETLTLMLIMVPGIPLLALFMTSGAVLVGLGRSNARASLDTISSVFLLAITLIAVKSHLHASGYAIAYVGSVAASCAVALILARRVVRPTLRGSGSGLSRMLRASLPFGQFDLFAVVYARADSIMLFLIRGSRSVALYGVAFQVATFLFAMPVLLSNALLPEFMGADTRRREYLARRALDVILTVALPLPLFGVLFARPFVIWIAGTRFDGAGPPLAILTGAGAIALLNGFLFQMAIFVGAEKGLWRVIGTVTIANLAANAVAVSLWGADGAAAVMILSEAIGLVMYWRLYRTKMSSPLGRRYPFSVLSASLILIVGWSILHASFNLNPGVGAEIIPRALALTASYGGLLWSLCYLARHVSRRTGLRSGPGI